MKTEENGTSDQGKLTRNMSQRVMLGPDFRKFFATKLKHLVSLPRVVPRCNASKQVPPVRARYYGFGNKAIAIKVKPPVRVPHRDSKTKSPEFLPRVRVLNVEPEKDRYRAKNEVGSIMEEQE